MPQVQTVTGPVNPSELGITLTHEHILVNLLIFAVKPKTQEERKLWNAHLSLSNLAILRRDPMVNRENNVLDSEKLAIDELLEFKKRGGKSVVDVTTDGIGRDVSGLRRIATKTGLNIVAASGWYQRLSHPPFVREKNADQLKEVILGEFQTGIGTTGIKPGVIKGACGGPPVPWHPEEKKVLTAICRAQREIGCPFTFHPLDMDDKRRKRLMIADEYVNLIEREGAMKEKFYLSHADDTCEDLEYHRRLMDRGIALNYDCFGSEVYWEKSFVGCRNPSDAERVSAVAKLCSEGYEGSLMLSHDICRKDRYRRYGGYTYSHILEVIVPRLRAMGIKQKQIRKMLVENPRRILAF